MLELKIGEANEAMDVLTFISSLVASIAWPFATFAIAFLFRAQVRKLLDRLRKLSVGDNSVDFGEKLDKAEADAEETIPAVAPEPIGLGIPDARTTQLIAISPSAAVLDAWRHIERETRKQAEPLMKATWPKSWRTMPFRAAVKALFDAGQITSSTYSLLHDLQELRNAAAHTDDVSAADAIRFAILAQQARLVLDGPDVRPDSQEGN